MSDTLEVGRANCEGLAPPRGAMEAAGGDADERREAPLFGAWHAAVHFRLWSDYRPSRWRWRAPPANTILLAVALTFIVWNVWLALVPEFAPGRTDIPQAVRDRAALLFVLCWLPMIRYLRTPLPLRRPVPFLGLYGCLYSLYYALTPMRGLANFLAFHHAGPAFDPSVDYARPVDLLLWGWIILTLAYAIMGAVRRRDTRRIDLLLRRLRVRAVYPWVFALLGLGIISEVLQRHAWWPERLAGIGNLLSIGMDGAVLALVVLYRRGKLPGWAARASVIGILVAVFISLGGSATARVLYVLFAILVGVWLDCRSMPAKYILAAAVAVAACTAIRGVMGVWRIEVWQSRRGEISATDRSNLMVALLTDKVETKGVAGAVADGWDVIGRRSANVDLLVDAIQRTPLQIPYWNGDTYESLVGAFVPRFFWPDKPRKTLGQDYGHRYRYLADSDTDTSFNLPVVVEFYINFGTDGLLLGMFVLGGLLRLVEDTINRPGQSLLITAAATPLLARLLVMENDLSLMFGGLPLQLSAFCLIAVVIMWHAGLLPRRGAPRPPWYAPLVATRGRAQRDAAAPTELGYESAA